MPQMVPKLPKRTGSKYRDRNESLCLPLISVYVEEKVSNRREKPLLDGTSAEPPCDLAKRHSFMTLIPWLLTTSQFVRPPMEGDSGLM